VTDYLKSEDKQRPGAEALLVAGTPL